jgi:hypothetical protein
MRKNLMRQLQGREGGLCGPRADLPVSACTHFRTHIKVKTDQDFAGGIKSSYRQLARSAFVFRRIIDRDVWIQ